MSLLGRKLEKVEREQHIKDIIQSQIKEMNVATGMRSTPVTKCNSFTQSILVHTKHGMIKRIITVPIVPNDSSPF